MNTVFLSYGAFDVYIVDLCISLCTYSHHSVVNSHGKSTESVIGMCGLK